MGKRDYASSLYRKRPVIMAQGIFRDLLFSDSYPKVPVRELTGNKVAPREPRLVLDRRRGFLLRVCHSPMGA